MLLNANKQEVGERKREREREKNERCSTDRELFNHPRFTVHFSTVATSLPRFLWRVQYPAVILYNQLNDSWQGSDLSHDILFQIIILRVGRGTSTTPTMCMYIHWLMAASFAGRVGKKWGKSRACDAKIVPISISIRNFFEAKFRQFK